MAASTSGIQGMQRRGDAIHEIQKVVRIKRLPNELLLRIFSHLSSVDDFLNVCLVCRHWKKMASNLSSMPMEVYLRVVHPGLKIRYIGESFWRKYESYFHLIAKDPLYKDREKIVEKAKKMLAEVSVENDAGITLLLEPEGFSFSRLRDGCKTLNDEGKDLFRYVSQRVVNCVGNDPVKETQLLGLTTGIVRDTRSKTVTQQQEALRNVGCELARVKTLSLLAIATFLESREKGEPIRLLGGHPERWTYSRCIESGENVSGENEYGVWNACVGGFLSAGLSVSNDGGYGGDDIGVVALRKF